MTELRYTEQYNPYTTIKHYGTLYYSGRYPWGSGENPYQRWTNFYGTVRKLREDGLTDKQIADSFGLSQRDLRARIAYGTDEERYINATKALKLKDKGWSNTAIAKEMNVGESQVRSWLDPVILERTKITGVIAQKLKDEVDASGVYLDVGKNVERHLGVSSNQLNAAVTKLKDDGYSVYTVTLPQVGTKHGTKYKVLCPPGTEWGDVMKNQNNIKPIEAVEIQASKDGGRTFRPFEKPKSIDSSRIEVRYLEDGGGERDGLIELRRGVDDISLANAKYAQVRIAVDDTHYLKGMAVHSDDMPKGVDVIFYTDKSKTKYDNKLDYMKVMKYDIEGNPFGANIRLEDELLRAQRYYVDKNGKEQLSAINIVNEEGNWKDWSKNLSSQMLSKQTPELAKQQLELDYLIRNSEYEDIKVLTNPVVKRKLLKTFSDECDSAAAHLKAAAMPRQNTQVIMPIESLANNEIYAPWYENGENVVLIRYPHGGLFEIPELKVNNKNKEARKMLAGKDGPPIDAVGINSKVAQQLSGADFDGDTVIVIPNNNKQVKTEKMLDGLKNFDPKIEYPEVPGMRIMGEKGGGQTNQEMGGISNLITDMTIKGAKTEEIERAVKHSMVVIDAEKHRLNYKKSEEDHGILKLKERYQGSSRSGASTLISKASSPDYGDLLKDYYKVDPKTGKIINIKAAEKDQTYVDYKTGEVKKRTTKRKSMDTVDDAFDLASTPITRIEMVYGNYANKMKSLANTARKEMVAVKSIPQSQSAKETYAKEVASLEAKLNIASKNSPLERQAQNVARAKIRLIKQDNPGMEKDDLKKISNYELKLARSRLGAKKKEIVPTVKEWEAIQAGAFSNTKLTDIINNANLETVKEFATPRTYKAMNTSKISKAKSMLARGYTWDEVAESLGVSVSTLSRAIDG